MDLFWGVHWQAGVILLLENTSKVTFTSYRTLKDPFVFQVALLFWYVLILMNQPSNQPPAAWLISSLFFILQRHFVHLNIFFVCLCVCCRISEGAHVQAWWRFLQCLWEEWQLWKHLVGKAADITCDFPPLVQAGLYGRKQIVHSLTLRLYIHL